MITNAQLEQLGGLVAGNKRSYRIEVKRSDDNSKEELDALFDVVISIECVGATVQTLRMKPGDPETALRSFVESIKTSAERDFE